MIKIKLKPNEPCTCLSGKKYKKCCYITDYNINQEEELKYLYGQSISSDKMKFCINYYKKMFDKHKIIDITDNITLDNYKTYQLRNYTNKTIMLASLNIVFKIVYAISCSFKISAGFSRFLKTQCRQQTIVLQVYSSLL